MDPPIVLLLIAIVCLLCGVFVPPRIAERHRGALGRGVVRIVSIQCCLAMTALAVYVWSGQTVQWEVPLGRIADVPFRFGVLLDGPSTLMLTLASFVGWIVSRFSIRYLDGESEQGRYFQWLGFTIGSISLMLIAGDLAVFFAASVLASAGLHRLLVHYRDRDQARRAAWTQFVVSRIGDAALLAAVVLTAATFQTLWLPDLFQQAERIASTGAVNGSHLAIGWLFVVSALAKSAQFPFHIWLPNTMETPTPVSALMHAGIVNSGGYLVIRLSPIVVLSASSLTFAACVGAVTACFAGIAMTTQSSVKRSLAYSTIAQMGFMMLQCGLGSFASAMTHLLVHSLYKAHAFLGSGGVIADSAGRPRTQSATATPQTSIAPILSAIVYAGASFSLIAYLASQTETTKSAGVALACIFCLALATWGWRLMMQRGRRPVLFALGGIAGLCASYIVCFVAVEHVIQPATPQSAVASLPVLAAAVSLVGLIPFALHMSILSRLSDRWLGALRVHALNGFYVDAILNRAVSSVARS